MTGIVDPLANVINSVEQVVLERHEKYGPGNIANAPGGPLNGLRVRLHDKLARLNNHVDTGTAADYADDSLRDCFVDIVGYGLIGLLVLDGHWPGVTKQAPQEAPVYNGCVHPPLRDRDGRVWVRRQGGYKLSHWPGDLAATRDRTYINARYGPLTEIHE